MQHFNFPESSTSTLIIIAATYWAPAGFQVPCEGVCVWVCVCVCFFTSQPFKGHIASFFTNVETQSPLPRGDASSRPRRSQAVYSMVSTGF